MAVGTSPGEETTKLKRRKAALQLGQRREDFELQGLLGKGSYACVYRARSRHSGREVALKIIDKQLIASCPGLAERVRAEAETHITLDHPSVVKLYNFFEDAACVYFVLELCEGGELYHYLRRSSGGLKEEEARTMLLMVLDGVKYLHAQHIVHRDLKLSNLLLTPEMQVKISDFGLSTTLEGERGESGTVCGTPNYMPPEVIADTPHGLASDLWSLGCLLYTLLVGVPPFESASLQATLDRIRRVDYTIPEHVSPCAADLIRRLLQHDPARRPSLDQVAAHSFTRGAAVSVTSAVQSQATSARAEMTSPCIPSAQAHSTCASTSLPSRRSPSPSPFHGAGAALRGRVSKSANSTTSTSTSNSIAHSSDAVPGPADASPPHQPAHVSDSLPHQHAVYQPQAYAQYQPPSQRPASVDAGNLHEHVRAALTSAARTHTPAAHAQSHTHVPPLRVPLRAEKDADGAFGACFASVMLSARSHTVATPVQSAHKHAGTSMHCDMAGPHSQHMPSDRAARASTCALVDARGLKACSYGTRHARVRVEPGVGVEASPMGNEDALLVVALGGKRVQVRTNGVPSDVWCSPEDLPVKWRAVYAHVAKVVLVIRSRTPKVIYYSRLAEATIMMDEGSAEERPPTFKCNFYSGGRVEYGGKDKRTACMRITTAVIGLTEAEALAHADECLRKCRKTDASFTKRRQTANAAALSEDISSAYPLIVADKDALHRVPRPQSESGRSRHTPQGDVSVHASMLSVSDTTTLRSVCSDGRSRASTMTSFVSASSSPPYEGGSSLGAVLQHQHAANHQYKQMQARQQQQQQQQQYAHTEQRVQQMQKEHKLQSVQQERRQANVFEHKESSAHQDSMSQRGGNHQNDEQNHQNNHQDYHQDNHPKNHQNDDENQGQNHQNTHSNNYQNHHEHSRQHYRYGSKDYLQDARSSRQAVAKRKEKLALGDEGRVFEFHDEASQPRVIKTAFFAGFGWVLCLADGSLWGQLLDGSQIVAAHSQVVYVSTDGQRILLPSSVGDSASLSGVPLTDPEILKRAEMFLELRQVL